MFNPSRLTLARKRRKLTGRELAGLAGVSQVHLSRIEQGITENPEDATVDSFVKVLKFPKGFFYGPDIDVPTPDSASFRSLSAMSARERDSSLAAGAVAFMFSDWVAEKFTLPKVDLLDLRHEKDAESAANALRYYWGLGEQPISNVIKLLESKGVRIFSLAEETKNVDAFSCWRNDIPYIFLNTFKTAERSRFDALHELGHLVLHRHGSPQGRELEREADNFASSFLIPSLDLMGYVPFVTSLEQLIKAKKRWGSSLAALAYRLNRAGRVSDWQYRTFCIQINKRFGHSEPEGMPRERSIVWEKIFRELWKDKQTTDHVAKALSIPATEIDQLVFNLCDDSPSGRPASGVKLRLA